MIMNRQSLLQHGQYNIIRNNDCRFNTMGIFISRSDYNEITNNNCNENDYYSFLIDHSTNNSIKGNSFSYSKTGMILENVHQIWKK